LNWRGELKRKIKFTKGSKIKIKRIRVRFEKITNHNYRFTDEIENKSKFKKEPRIKFKNKKIRTKVEISVNKRTTMKFWMTNVDFYGEREKREKNRENVIDDTSHINNNTCHPTRRRCLHHCESCLDPKRRHIRH